MKWTIQVYRERETETLVITSKEELNKTLKSLDRECQEAYQKGLYVGYEVDEF